MRILIVEDEPTLQAQLAEGLGAAGYAVDTAGNGVDGHYQGDSEAYDAVVLDLGLPQMDGITVLRKWRAAGRTMPVLILTARDGWHEKVAGIDAGADDYLTKPFHMEELLARLRALIRRAGGHIYAQDFDRDSNTVEVFIARLRKKLPPGLIETVRGLGYRLSAPQ
jgi:two-component system OmpR family response regulator